jgi:hypothetical protein
MRIWKVTAIAGALAYCLGSGMVRAQSLPQPAHAEPRNLVGWQSVPAFKGYLSFPEGGTYTIPGDTVAYTLKPHGCIVMDGKTGIFVQQLTRPFQVAMVSNATPPVVTPITVMNTRTLAAALPDGIKEDTKGCKMPTTAFGGAQAPVVAPNRL